MNSLRIFPILLGIVITAAEAHGAEFRLNQIGETTETATPEIRSDGILLSKPAVNDGWPFDFSGATNVTTTVEIKIEPQSASHEPFNATFMAPYFWTLRNITTIHVPIVKKYVYAQDLRDFLKNTRTPVSDSQSSLLNARAQSVWNGIAPILTQTNENHVTVAYWLALTARDLMVSTYRLPDDAALASANLLRSARDDTQTLARTRLNRADIDKIVLQLDARYSILINKLVQHLENDLRNQRPLTCERIIQLDSLLDALEPEEQEKYNLEHPNTLKIKTDLLLCGMRSIERLTGDERNAMLQSLEIWTDSAQQALEATPQSSARRSVFAGAITQLGLAVREAENTLRALSTTEQKGL